MKKGLRLAITLTLVAAASLTPLFFAVSCSNEDVIKVIEVHDGDTFKYGDGNKIRLFGVDAPEISVQESEDGGDYIPTTGLKYLYAVEARDFAADMILNKEVNREYIKNDPYNREVTKIFVDGKDLGKELISHGLARMQYISLEPGNPFYTTDYKYYNELCQIQYQAYYSNVGIWSHKELVGEIF